ncbi:hypothetical protein ACFL16_03080 [Patescibacteria group bacterium]
MEELLRGIHPFSSFVSWEYVIFLGLGVWAGFWYGHWRLFRESKISFWCGLLAGILTSGSFLGYLYWNYNQFIQTIVNGLSL